MPASTIEAYLARAFAVLQSAGTAAITVARGRPDAFDAAELPAISLRRGNTQHQPYGTAVDQTVLEIELDHHVRGADWETTADSLHMQAHAALQSDATLKALGKGLRCIRSEASADTGDQTLGRITATYQVHTVVRLADLTLLA